MALNWLWAAETTAAFQRICGQERVAVTGSSSSNGVQSHYEGVPEYSPTRNGQDDTKGTGHVTANGVNGVLRANGVRPARNGSVKGNGSAAATTTTTTTTTTTPVTKVAETKVIHKYLVLKYLFQLAGVVGEEGFFIAFLPIMFWNFDFFVGRRVVLMWFHSVYFGTALKDYLRSERPSDKIVIREVNDEHCLEYGLPSTHTISGAIISVAIVYTSYQRYNLPLLPAVTVAVLLVMCMGMSRLYSGHHLLIDVLAAIAIVFATIFVESFLVESIDALYMQPSLLGPLCVLLTAALALYIYPHPPEIRASSRDMPIIVGVFVGFYLGLWVSTGMNPPDNRHLEPFDLPNPDRSDVLAGILRYITGVSLLLVCRLILKTSSLKFFSQFADKSKGPAKEQLTVVLCYRLVTYSGSCAVVAIAPLWFSLLGVPRQTA